MRKGSTGQFDVVADGKVIFSKKQAGRFPIDQEVEDRLAAFNEGRELPPDQPGPEKGVLARLADRLRK